MTATLQQVKVPWRIWRIDWHSVNQVDDNDHQWSIMIPDGWPASSTCWAVCLLCAAAPAPRPHLCLVESQASCQNATTDFHDRPRISWQDLVFVFKNGLAWTLSCYSCIPASHRAWHQAEHCVLVTSEAGLWNTPIATLIQCPTKNLTIKTY